MDQPLWHGPPPSWAERSWKPFAKSWQTRVQGFDPWIGWYEALLSPDGRSSRDFFGEELTLRIATQPNKWWERPVAAINADIAQWLKERRSDPVPDRVETPPHSPAPDTAALEQAIAALPAQGPAPFSFEFRDDKLFLAPTPGPTDPGGMVQDYLDESRDKAGGLIQRLKRANADAHVTSTIENLLVRLPARTADIRPALLDSRRMSISAIATAYAAPGAEQELFPDAIAQILDLSLTLDRLCSRLPELRAMAVDDMAKAAMSGDVSALLEAAQQTVERIEESQLLDSSASEAVGLVAADAGEPAPADAKARRVVYLLETVRNLLLELLRLGRRPVAAVLNELRALLKEGYASFRPKLVKTVDFSYYAGLVYVVEAVAGPLGTLASLTGFKSINDVVLLIQRLIS